VTRLLPDQGLPRAAATLLAASGWDVVHVSDIGMSRSNYLQIVQRAVADSHVCVTLDADSHAPVALSRNT
jgi:predicted nuclease of predicted toxin-antitoxin system